MRQSGAQAVTAIAPRFEQLRDLRVIDRAAIPIALKVLLADVGDVAVLTILGEQMIEGLFAAWAHFQRDRFVPFLAIGEDGVDIENNAAKIEHLMAHHIANSKMRVADRGR